jgi:hypothetical protein
MNDCSARASPRAALTRKNTMQCSHNAKMRNAATSVNGNATIQSHLLSRLTAKFIQIRRLAMGSVAQIKQRHTVQPNVSSPIKI